MNRFAFRGMALTAAAASTLALVPAAPAMAKECAVGGTEGAVMGAIAGGVLGNVIAGRGSRTTGTLLGAVVGGVAGREVARSGQERCENRQEETRGEPQAVQATDAGEPQAWQPPHDYAAPAAQQPVQQDRGWQPPKR